MARNLAKAKGRAEFGQYLALPFSVLRSAQYMELSPSAVKLLVDIGAQYRGYNNGDLCASMTLMRKRGWRSNSALSAALRELLAAGLLRLTRQGGRHVCSLYALGWRLTDDCDGKLDPALVRGAGLFFAGTAANNGANAAP